MNSASSQPIVASATRARSPVRALVLIVLAAVVSGCAFAPKAPLGVVDLPMPAAATPSNDSLALQLVVMEPQASALLDSARIVVRDEDGQIAQLAGVALPDRAPRWLQSQLLQALAGRAFAGVSAPGSGLKPDLQLNLRIEHFEVDYRGEPQAAVGLHALLLDAPHGRAIATRRFEANATVEAAGSRAGAEALQRASHAAILELSAWAESRARELHGKGGIPAE